MKLVIEKATLEFPLTISLTGLPIINGKTLDAVWRANSLPELYSKLKTYTNLNIELVLPEELLTNNKYRLPEEDIKLYQREENLALIRFNDELLIMSIEKYTHPIVVLESLLNAVCKKVKFYSLDSDRDSIIDRDHKKQLIWSTNQVLH